MRNYILLFVVIVLLFSCSHKKEKVLLAHEQKKIAGLFLRREGGADFGVIFKIIDRKDSSIGVITTVNYWRQDIVPVLDSVTKKPLLDSTGFPQRKAVDIRMAPDSLVLDFQGRDLDSLVKAKWGK